MCACKNYILRIVVYLQSNDSHIQCHIYKSFKGMKIIGIVVACIRQVARYPLHNKGIFVKVFDWFRKFLPYLHAIIYCVTGLYLCDLICENLK